MSNAETQRPLVEAAFRERHLLQDPTHRAAVQGTIDALDRGEIRVASLFKDTPAEFLRMIVVHELAHLKERAHDKAFYQLCTYMEPDYHQLEFDVRLYLTHLDAVGPIAWGANGGAAGT